MQGFFSSGSGTGASRWIGWSYARGPSCGIEGAFTATLERGLSVFVWKGGLHYSKSFGVVQRKHMNATTKTVNNKDKNKQSNWQQRGTWSWTFPWTSYSMYFTVSTLDVWNDTLVLLFGLLLCFYLFCYGWESRTWEPQSIWVQQLAKEHSPEMPGDFYKYVFIHKASRFLRHLYKFYTDAH